MPAPAATATPAAPETKASARPKPKKQPPYHVVLINDDDHSYAYVIEMMKKLFAHPQPRGFVIAKEVDTQGRAIVLTTTKEHAELKRDQITAYGKDKLVASCQGSMTAVIEAGEEGQ